MSKQKSQSQTDSKTTSNNDLLRLYEFALGNIRYEGDGIWSRFNIIVGINLALLGAFGYVYLADENSRPAIYRQISFGIGIAGLMISIWSWLVLRKLWRWLEHWRSILIKLESQFPDNPQWVKLFSEQPDWMQKETKGNQGYLSYTHPFIFTFVAGWIAILILFGAGAL